MRSPPLRACISVRAFADLCITGLTTQVAVRRYRTIWAEHGDTGIALSDVGRRRGELSSSVAPIDVLDRMTFDPVGEHSPD